MYDSPDVEIGNTKFGGNGLFVTRHISAQEDILRVPAHFFLQYDTFITKYPQIQGKTFDKRLEFACCLCLEMSNSSSRYLEYFKTLPTSYTNPIMFSEEEISQFQNKNFVNRLNTKRERIVREFSKISEKIEASISLQDVLGCYALVESRTLYYPTKLDPKSEVGVLVPLYDMANHSQQVNRCNIFSLFYFDEETKEYVLKAYRDYNPGDQVYISYGSYNNQHFIEYYGFIPNGNPNIVQVSVRWNQLNIPLVGQFESLCLIGIEFPNEIIKESAMRLKMNTSLHISAQGEITEELLLQLLCLKKLNLKSKNIKEIISKYKQMGDQFYDPEKYDRLLQELSRYLISDYPSTLDKDRHDLNNQKSLNLQLCHRFRILEKMQIQAISKNN